MSTDCVSARSLPIRANEPDESTDRLAEQWWHAVVAFAVLLALLTIGARAMNGSGDQPTVPVIHESY
jgi:hypothetical protein